MFKIIETSTDELIIAEKISQSIINSKLSPCVQIIDGIKSYYIWKNKIVSSNEYTIKIKTVENHINKISLIIKEKSNYDVPEVISYDFRIEDKEYENWFNENI
jgi:periplasmic divalent cation tolerance protein